MTNVMTDKNLSFKAKGAYSIIVHLAESNIEISMQNIMSLTTDGEKLVRGAVNELIENGYIERVTIRKDGKISGMKYIIAK